MEKKEFKDLIFSLANSYSSNQTFINSERENAKKIAEYDPKLSELLNKHINLIEEIYTYILAKTEKNDISKGVINENK